MNTYSKVEDVLHEISRQIDLLRTQVDWEYVYESEADKEECIILLELHSKLVYFKNEYL